MWWCTIKVKPNMAAGVDSIPARLSKMVNPVPCLLNLPFTLATVPQLWKQANISPVYKDGDTGSLTNYRGISLLYLLGVCFEGLLMGVWAQ